MWRCWILAPLLLSACASPLNLRLSAQTSAGRALRPGDTVRSGDTFRLTIELDQLAYLYRLHRDPSGKTRVLARLGRHQGLVDLFLRLDHETGVETPIIVAARAEQPEPALLALVLALPSDSKDPPPCQPKHPDCTRGPELRTMGSAVSVVWLPLLHK